MKKTRNLKGVRLVWAGIGAAMFIALAIAGPAMAGYFQEVYVDGTLVGSGQSCSWLDRGDSVTGVYIPDNEYDADIDWKLSAGSTWHDANTMGGGTGAVAFWFTMNDYLTGSDKLYVKATEVIPDPDIVQTWWCSF